MSLLLCLNVKEDGDFGKCCLWSVLAEISEAEYLGFLLPRPCHAPSVKKAVGFGFCGFLCNEI